MFAFNIEYSATRPKIKIDPLTAEVIMLAVSSMTTARSAASTILNQTFTVLALNLMSSLRRAVREISKELGRLAVIIPDEDKFLGNPRYAPANDLYT